MDIFIEDIKQALHDKYNSTDQKHELLDKLKNINFEKFTQQVVNDLSDTDFTICKEKMFEEVFAQECMDNEFKSRLVGKWNKAFIASKMMYSMVLETAEYYTKNITKKGNHDIELKKWCYTALLNIHARGMQIYLEIIELMTGGFADGAYGRWRSLYELAVYASFIEKYGEEVARSFCESSQTDDSYPNWAKTSGAFRGKNITFAMIEKKASLNSEGWHDSYKLACKINHASPQATFKRLGNYPLSDEDFLPVGRSDYGLETVGECSAISLMQLSIIFFSILPDGYTNARMLTIEKWADFVRKEYYEAHDRIFPEDEKLCEKYEL